MHNEKIVRSCLCSFSTTSLMPRLIFQLYYLLTMGYLLISEKVPGESVFVAIKQEIVIFVWCALNVILIRRNAFSDPETLSPIYPHPRLSSVSISLNSEAKSSSSHWAGRGWFCVRSFSTRSLIPRIIFQLYYLLAMAYLLICENVHGRSLFVPL